MAATAEQVTAEPGPNGTARAQWGWRISTATPPGRLAQGSHLDPVSGSRWVLALERIKHLFEETLYPGHRATLSSQVKSPFGDSPDHWAQTVWVSMCDWVCWFVDCGSVFITIIAKNNNNNNNNSIPLTASYLCDKPGTQRPTDMISFNPHTLRKILLLLSSPFSRKGN